MFRFEIRNLQPKDRSAVFQIAADTAFFGAPIENFFEDRSLFCEAFCAYYTDFEPDHGWVAEENGNVVGYLFGCANTSKMNHLFKRKILPPLLLRLSRGDFHLGKQSNLYLWRLGMALLKGEIPKPDLVRFPAHLHINITANQRGRGIGKALLEHFLKQLRHEQVEGVHLKTTSENQIACYLYEKLGFTLLERRCTNLWRPWLRREIETRCYAMSLK